MMWVAKAEVSVIVPLYNVELYVDSLVESLVGQDINLIKVVFVNDGSTDNTVKNLKLALASAQVTLDWILVEKENGGLSDARNCGLSHCTTKYVAFLDPDDTLSCGYYTELYRSITATDSMVALSSSVEVSVNGTKKWSVYEEVVLDGVEVIDKLFLYDWSACTKLFARKLFQEEKFDLGLRFEDLALVPSLLSQCSKVCVCGNAIYYYQRRADSITKKLDIEKEFDIFTALDLLFERLIKHGEQRQIKKIIQKVLIQGFLPNVVLRYEPSISKRFISHANLYIKKKQLNLTPRIQSPSDWLLLMFYFFPIFGGRLITLLYRVARKVTVSASE